MRVATLWEPTDGLKLQLSYYYQNSEGNGYPYAAPMYGVNTLQSPDYFRETTRDRVEVAPFTAEYDLGFATVTSATAWAHHTNHTLDDGTAPYENLPGYISYYGANPPRNLPPPRGIRRQALDRRAASGSKSGGAIEWVAGAFFNSESTSVQDHDYYPGYNNFYNACAPTYGAGSAQCGAGEYGPMNGVTSVDGIH